MPSLVLCPVDPGWQPASPDRLQGLLYREGLIGTHAASGTSDGWQAGEHFLRLVMFLGCSPQVALTEADAPDGQAICSVRIRIFDQVRFVASQRRPAVRCPHCRTSAEVGDPVAGEVYRCGQCGRETPVEALDWRQAAGFGRVMIVIEGVYPHEAVPADGLLESLRAYSGGEWEYFYLDKEAW